MSDACKRPVHVMPLEDFPADKQAEIAELVALPYPPPKWLDFGLWQCTSRAWSEWYWQRDAWHPGQEGSPRRPAISVRIRQAVYDRDGHRCLRCGDTSALSLDHIKHWSRGGQDTVANLRTLCRSCNSERRTRTWA